MIRKEAMRLVEQTNTLVRLGFTTDEAWALRRISMTLRRWYELVCGTDRGYITRDEMTGKPFMSSDHERWHAIHDRETGAIKRLNTIMLLRNTRKADALYEFKLCYYLQTDPRGAALYIIRPGDVPEGEDVGAYYSRGVVVH